MPERDAIESPASGKTQHHRERPHDAPHPSQHRRRRRKPRDVDDRGEDEQEGNKDGAPPTKPFYKRPLLMTAIVVGSLLLIAGGVGYWLHSRHYQWTDDAFIDGHIVQMAAKVAGYVEVLNIDDNQFVHEGDVLFEIDPRDYVLALERARTAADAATENLRQTDVQISAAKAQQKVAEADLVAAEATAMNAAQQLERNAKLAPLAVSRESVESLTASARSTAAQVTAARDRVAAATAQVELTRAQRDSAEASQRQAEVQVRQAELNLSYCHVTAPISGRITHRSVELGDYVQPGAAVFAIVDPNVWVTANYKETQLTDMRVGQPVAISIDAYPSHELHGHVDSFQRGSGARFSLLPAENATGNYVKVVQRVPVKIVFDEPLPDDMIVGPGMSVVPSVTVK